MSDRISDLTEVAMLDAWDVVRATLSPDTLAFLDGDATFTACLEAGLRIGIATGLKHALDQMIWRGVEHRRDT